LYYLATAEMQIILHYFYIFTLLFQTHKQLKQRWDNYGSCLCPGESTLLPPCHIKFL
ncbi:hypothetical protein T4B_7518, partial [Trichinella pseudospiralis]